ncbi:MAG: DUF1836 domain-containing protein [Clostridiales Family XIII bacterium]|jgi:hypothetical protein|nr:DUF1836 domain-containing protein [Clostridiales Family XIII bacterium]
MVRYEDFIRDFAEKFAENNLIEPEDFPEFPLYADQVSEFFTTKLDLYGKDPVITRSSINDFVKDGLLSAPNKKKYSREQMVMIEFILCFKVAYSKKDTYAVLKPFVENAESKFDEKIDLYDLYVKLAPIFKQQRKVACENAVATIDTIKEAIRGEGMDDDDMLEMFLFLLSIAAQADAALLIGKKMLHEYFKK